MTHGSHTLGARIRALDTLEASKLGALAAEADRLQQRAEDAEAGILELVPGRWWAVQAPDGSTRASTSNEDEARASVRPGDALLRQFVTPTREEYRVVETASRPDDGDDGRKVFMHG